MHARNRYSDKRESIASTGTDGGRRATRKKPGRTAECAPKVKQRDKEPEPRLARYGDGSEGEKTGASRQRDRGTRDREATRREAGRGREPETELVANEREGEGGG